VRLLRVLLWSLLIGGVLLAALWAGQHPQPAQAASVWIQVKPSSVLAGYQVTITASCQDNTNAATVKSTVFGTVTVSPYNGILSATVTVPAATRDGGYDVTLTCKTGSSAITTLWIIEQTATETEPPVSGSGPHTGGGFLATGDRDTGALLTGSVALLVVGTALGVTIGMLNSRRSRRHTEALRNAPLSRPRPR
jgi:hypothetical protein